MDYLNETGTTASDESKLRSWQRELMNHFDCKCKHDNALHLESVIKGAGKTEHCEKHSRIMQSIGRVSRNKPEETNAHYFQIEGRNIRLSAELDVPVK